MPVLFQFDRINTIFEKGFMCFKTIFTDLKVQKSDSFWAKSENSGHCAKTVNKGLQQMVTALN